MTVRVLAEPFEPWQALAGHERQLSERAGQTGRYGATAVFVGTMRDFNQGDAVRAMTLEHYPGMTERELEAMVAEAHRRWQLVDALVMHRYGELKPNDPIVLVAVWSAHREQAFAACRYLIEELKTRAPFWKHEDTTRGPRWVDSGAA